MFLLDYLAKKSPQFIWTIALLLNLFIGVIDYFTGYEIGIEVFYLMPIGLLSWFVNRSAGIIMSVISTATFIIANLLAGKVIQNYLIESWNILVHFGFFIVVVYLISVEKIISDNNKILIVKYQNLLEALRESESRFRLLSTTAGRLLRAEDPQIIVEDLCRDVMAQLDCQAFFNFLVDEKAGRLRLNACAGVSEEEARAIEWLDFGVAVSGCVTQEGRRIIAEDILHTADVQTELVKPYGIRAYCCHPLMSQNRLIGTLSFGTKIRAHFTPNEVDLMRIVTDQVVVAMQRKQAEKDLRERTVKLEEVNKELESFSYSVAHDLRAPLRAIDGYARMILKKQGDKFDKDTLDKFDAIRSNTHMMGQLIDDLLTFSRLGRKQISLSPLDMDILMKDAWKEMQASDPERDMKLKENSMPPGYGDRALIKQVLINLLSNAVKFTKYKEVPNIEVGGYAEGNEHVYYVRDNGVGFDMAYYDKLFGVFQRLHSTDQFEGTGVGLATVQRIIHRHGGRVWAEGKVDEGAIFYFSLPSSHTIDG
ncbi:MAG: ATP-binding protein [Syntrophales bacterium]|jgi:K+-sensing histidine kinase KdpD